MNSVRGGVPRNLRGFLVVLLSVAGPALPAAADESDREIVRGPYVFSVRGGAQSDSASAGADGRVDFLNPAINIHLFATYDRLDDGRGIGEIDDQRYGGGLALSHTFSGRVNLFAGGSAISELDESFSHAYLGGKVRFGDHAIVSASYGFGLGDPREITAGTARSLLAEAVNWGKLGVVLVGGNGWKGSFLYRLTDPGEESISGAEGSLSYPVTDAFTIGVAGDSDITTEEGVDRNWRGYVVASYAFGGQKGTPIEIALEKNDPVAYPVVLRMEGKAPAAGGGVPLTISPTSPMVGGCSAGSVIFTASGGAPPYTWSSNGQGNFIPDYQGDNTMAYWDDSSDDYCGGGAFQVTLMDSAAGSAVADVTVTGS